MKKLLAITCSLLALVSCRASLDNGPLDGRVYQVQLAGGGKAPMDDALVFDGGRFESTACRNYGFRLADYHGAIAGDAGTFEANAMSSDSGATVWSGKIEGESVEGTMKWTNAKGEVTDFKFKGKSASGLLDGKTFEGMVCPGDSKTGDKDQLIFKAGAFDSSACRAYGFTKSPYTATREGDATRFTATATNADGDQNHWEGTIRGDDVTGTMEHRNAAGKVLDKFKFVAKLAK